MAGGGYALRGHRHPRRPTDKRFQMIHAALSFTPDTYGRNSRALGRRVANTAFLRAVVSGRSGEPVAGYGYEDHHGVEFAELVQSIDPNVRTRWMLMTQLDDLAAQKVIHRLDHAISAEVWARTWGGVGRYSISAVAHTIFNRLADLALLVREPLMPWDALICTSRSVHSAVTAVFEAEGDYARWRYGGGRS